MEIEEINYLLNAEFNLHATTIEDAIEEREAIKKELIKKFSLIESGSAIESPTSQLGAHLSFSFKTKKEAEAILPNIKEFFKNHNAKFSINYVGDDLNDAVEDETK